MAEKIKFKSGDELPFEPILSLTMKMAISENGILRLELFGKEWLAMQLGDPVTGEAPKDGDHAKILCSLTDVIDHFAMRLFKDLGEGRVRINPQNYVMGKKI